jgi:hypothetical protein
LVLLGVALMIAGAFMPWNVNATLQIPPALGLQVAPDITGFEWGLPALDVVTEDIAPGQRFIIVPNLYDPLVSTGALVIFLALVASLGLAWPKGRLTLITSAVVALGLTGFIYSLSHRTDVGQMGPGPIVIIVGCVLAFIGSLLTKK